ncbi:MAG: DPP IV N-terminal domain-containing protein [Planctomycetaceae bacterium]|nr:DPP IV N-terminal domain-containing protein [Planctomycetaceae bacterium]
MKYRNTANFVLIVFLLTFSPIREAVFSQVEATVSGAVAVPSQPGDISLPLEVGAKPLTVERIYASSEFSERSARQSWYSEGATFRVEESGSVFLEDPVTGDRELLIDAKQLTPPGGTSPLASQSMTFSDDHTKLLLFTNTRRVWRHNTRGDYWVLDLHGRQPGSQPVPPAQQRSEMTGSSRDSLVKLGGNADEASLMFAKFSPDATKVAYVRENNIYVENLATREITALTANGGERFINGTFDWVYEEEFSLTDGFRWSPDSRNIAFWQLDTEGEPVFTMIDHLSEKYPVTQQFKYPRAGDTNAAVRVGIVSTETGETVWPQIPGDPREHYITALYWLDGRADGNGFCQWLIVQQFNRLQNVMTLYSVNPATGTVVPFLTDRDDAWIDLTPIRWLSDGKRFVWQSEQSGWRRLYLTETTFSGETPDASQTIPLTPEGMDMIEFAAFDYTTDADAKTESGVYFYASPDNATQRYLYRIDLTGGNFRRVTPTELTGTNTYRISPVGQYAVHQYSTFGTPPVTNLLRLPSHEIVRNLADNRALQDKLETLNLGQSELLRVTTGSNVTLDGWAIYPPHYDANRPEKYPVVVYVYGEPAGQTVLDRWGGSSYLWHQMLAQHGVVVMSFDNRGTPAPKGREWRKCIYRKLGLLGPQDQAEAMRVMLEANPKLDAGRVAIWGWSGGGSSTLHAMFRHGDVFKVGIAVAAVPDERNYDTIYQERYMGNPAVDAAEDYRLCSPVTYAQNLMGELLIVHGTTDDNCHYQSFDQLIDMLVKHGKQFRMMSYPSRTHGIFEREGTTLHLRNLMFDFFREKLQMVP